MKKHITVKQLNELNEKGKRKYWKITWSKLEGKDIDNIQDAKTGRFYYKDSKNPPLNFYPLLSIGQMIELLDENKKLNSETVMGYRESEHGSIIEYKTQEGLCDNLWQAVKKVLTLEDKYCKCGQVKMDESEFCKWCI